MVKSDSKIIISLSYKGSVLIPDTLCRLPSGHSYYLKGWTLFNMKSNNYRMEYLNWNGHIVKLNIFLYHVLNLLLTQVIGDFVGLKNKLITNIYACTSSKLGFRYSSRYLELYTRFYLLTVNLLINFASSNFSKVFVLIKEPMKNDEHRRKPAWMLIVL